MSKIIKLNKLQSLRILLNMNDNYSLHFHNPKQFICPSLNALVLDISSEKLPPPIDMEPKWRSLAIMFPNLESLDVQITWDKYKHADENEILDAVKEADIENLNAFKVIIRDLSWQLFPKLKHFNGSKSFAHFGRHQSWVKEKYYGGSIY